MVKLRVIDRTRVTIGTDFSAALVMHTVIAKHIAPHFILKSTILSYPNVSEMSIKIERSNHHAYRNSGRKIRRCVKSIFGLFYGAFDELQGRDQVDQLLIGDDLGDLVLDRYELFDNQ